MMYTGSQNLEKSLKITVLVNTNREICNSSVVNFSFPGSNFWSSFRTLWVMKLRTPDWIFKKSKLEYNLWQMPPPRPRGKIQSLPHFQTLARTFQGLNASSWSRCPSSVSDGEGVGREWEVCWKGVSGIINMRTLREERWIL
jgi:hypothetical protein